MIKKEDLGVNGISVYQDSDLYTFTSDSVLLAKFTAVKKGDVVADFCAGSGIVGFYLYGLNAEKTESLTFFELQNELSSLCEKSIKENALEDKCKIVKGKLQDIDKEYNEKFSLIVCNPPYMKADAGEFNKNASRAICMAEVMLSLDELITAVAKSLKFGGRVNLVHRADRMAEVLAKLSAKGLEPKKLQLVCPKNKPPYLFMVEAVKGGKVGLKVLNNIEN